MSHNTEVFNTITSCFKIKDFTYLTYFTYLTTSQVNLPKKAIGKEGVFQTVPRTRKKKKAKESTAFTTQPTNRLFKSLATRPSVILKLG